MKNIFFLCVVSLFMYSCQNDFDKLEEQQQRDEQISERRTRDCEQNFTPGNVYGDLFGNNPFAKFGEPGYRGSFENQYFPCQDATASDNDGDCCNETIIFEPEFPITDMVPFSTICNGDLDAQELQQLADVIATIAQENQPRCSDGITLSPVAINVYRDIIGCCVFDPPCPWLDDQCDCFDETSNNPYWGCCESYVLRVQIKYARTGPCFTLCC